MSITLTINGEPRTIDADPDTPLLWVLRDELGMTGTKFGCGIAQCGACTVHLDGMPIRSCQTMLEDVGDASITTIEGIDGKAAKAVQAAWQELEVPQCGYCQSGQVMAATALLETNPDPTDAEIREALDRNLCRCGAHNRIVRAVRRASVMMAEAAS